MMHLKQLTALALAFVIAASVTRLVMAQTVAPDQPGASMPTPSENDLVGRSVHCVDGHQVGRVDAVEADSTGRIAAIEVVLGSLLRLSPKTVRVTRDSISQAGLEVWVTMTGLEVIFLPGIDEPGATEKWSRSSVKGRAPDWQSTRWHVPSTSSTHWHSVK
jgi:hypothetical protein